MNSEFKGKLTVRKTKRGFHVEIIYGRGGKSKKITFPASGFVKEVSGVNVSFVMEGNKVVEIKDERGEVVWQLFRKEHTTKNGKPTKDRGDSEEKLPLLKIHKDAFQFLEKIKYWKDTRNTLNPALRFNKFLVFDRKQGKFDYTKTISSSGKEYFSIPENIFRRIEILTQEKNYDPVRFCVRSWELKTQWRMVVGLGSPHVHETAMTWHHTWSIPYIPGSALKGIARSYHLGRLWERFSPHLPNESWEESICCLEAWMMDEAHPSVGHKESQCPVFQWASNNLKGEKEIFQAIFGTQNKKGAVIFMDTYPLDRFYLKLDVMNVHYPEYYRGEKEYAADWESPNPVFFLTVVDTRFRGILLVDKKRLKESEFTLTSDGLLEKVKNTLTEALKNHGIGAKTSVGYGILF